MWFPTRRWFLETRGWKPIAVSIALSLVLVLLAVAVSHAEPAQKMQRPETAAAFVKNFRAGEYGHNPKNVKYSKAFAKAYKHRYVVAYRKHHKSRTDCTNVGTCGVIGNQAWTRFKKRDTCGGTFRDDYSSVKCNLTKAQQYNIENLVSSPYWKARGELQNKWTVRILFCGGVGVLTLVTGGTAQAAIGPGTVGCVGSFFVR